MKHPEKPPVFGKMFPDAMKDPNRFLEIVRLSKDERFQGQYLHWDKLKRYEPPKGFSREDVWVSLKLSRIGMRQIPLTDSNGNHFQFCIPDMVLKELHEIDIGAGGALGVPEPITNPQTKDRYMIRSLMEEAITSSQLEGAATTREVAKEMIRAGRAPRDIGEQMILNNFVTLQRISELKKEPMSSAVVFAVHKLVTDKTLDDASAAGRFRRADENPVVGDEYGEVFHVPPPAEQLEARLAAMCDFANAVTPSYFVHPVLRAIILHFWLAYDHPFVDGNGRTARALFYWSMLRDNCWLFEFVSISHILRKAPAKYARSFLYTESDDNDLTYFIVAQTEVIRRAIAALHAYVDAKSGEMRELESRVRSLTLFNHRQADIIRHALKHPFQAYTFDSHQKSHQIAYQTARTDLLNLRVRGLLEAKKQGKRFTFISPEDLSARLRKIGREPL